MSRRSTSMHAFGLVEVVLTAAIVSIVALMAVPRYAEALVRYRLDAAARRVQTDLQTAQAFARARSAAVTVTFDVTASTLTLSSAANLPASTFLSVTRLAEDPYRVKLTNAAFDQKPFMEINAFGRVLHGGVITLESGERVRQLEVQAGSGQVVVR